MDTSVYMNVFIFTMFSIFITVLSLKIPTVSLDFRNWIFKEREWENGGIVYQRVFKVKHWKIIIPELSDYAQPIFQKKRIASYDKDYLYKYLIESCRAELTHWGIIFSSILFVFWSSFPQTVAIILFAFVMNLPFVIIQRYNRPRIICFLANSDRRMEGATGKSLCSEERGPISILFISAEETGHGHKSITKALQQQITNINPNIHVSIIDGFSLGNWMMRASSRMYNPLVVNMPVLWGLLYRTGNYSMWPINALVSKIIKNNLIKHLEEIRPDVIIPVHGVFVGSVLNILEKENLDTPVIPFIADLDNITSLWADKRAKYTLCPSMESRQMMLSLGIEEDKLKLVDFPVRNDFCDISPTAPKAGKILADEGVSILLINGSQGSWRILKMVRSLLKHINCRITVIAGNNSFLKKYLEKNLSLYIGKRVHIYGFTKDIKGHMFAADILVIRASPNVLMEAVTLCKPVIIVGALKGQEEKNPEFVVRHNLGVYCRDIKKLPNILLDLLAHNGEKLKEIYDNQVKFRNPQAAREIAEFIISDGCQAAGFYTLSSESNGNVRHATGKSNANLKA